MKQCFLTRIDQLAITHLEIHISQLHILRFSLVRQTNIYTYHRRYLKFIIIYREHTVNFDKSIFLENRSVLGANFFSAYNIVHRGIQMILRNCKDSLCHANFQNFPKLCIIFKSDRELS